MKTKYVTECSFTLDEELTTLSDKAAVLAAKASLGASDYDPERAPRMIKFLVDAGHGSPFEHTVISGIVEAPIFVAREFMRHRLASYNELSMRYKILDEVRIYIPGPGRPLVETGRPGSMRMTHGTKEQDAALVAYWSLSCMYAVRAYEGMLDAGIAREVASRILPVSMMTTFRVTMNARSLSNFLSLRIFSEDADRPSFPQWETQQLAELMEAAFKERMPLTYAAWVKNGRRPL